MKHLLILLLLLVCPLAKANPAGDKDRGNKAWIDAVAAYDRGDFDMAILKFEEAHRLLASATVFYNLGMAHRQKGNLERALFYFREYVREKPNGRNRAEADRLIRELEPQVAPPKPAEPPPPVPPAPAVPAPAPQISIAKRPPERPWYLDPVGLSLVGGGLATAGVGIGFLVRSGSLSDDAATELDQGRAISLHDSAGRAQTAGEILVAIGGAAVAGGVVKMLLFRPHGREVHVGVVISPRAVALSGSF